jgi:hypothetical protein
MDHIKFSLIEDGANAFSAEIRATALMCDQGRQPTITTAQTVCRYIGMFGKLDFGFGGVE